MQAWYLVVVSSVEPNPIVCSKDLKVPHPNMSLYKSSLAYSGSTLWNSLPLTIRGSSSIFSFKFLVRNYLTSTNVR